MNDSSLEKGKSEYVAVRFDDGSVQSIPYSWMFNENFALYPNIKDTAKMKEAVQCVAKPEEKWKLYKLKEIIGRYGNYILLYENIYKLYTRK